ncbi:MAG TPA: hypothetical protein DDW27_01620, partial [Bacteroidales bacterium]|nr:hypothetical protein [Bacteroidales bacterium]
MRRRELISNILLSALGLTITGGISCKNRKFPGTILIFFAISLAVTLNSCQRPDSVDLYSGFQNPPAEARP